MQRSTAVLDLLIPSLRYQLEFEVHSVHPAGAADMLNCLVGRGKENSPVLSIAISMPTSQLEME